MANPALQNMGNRLGQGGSYGSSPISLDSVVQKTALTLAVLITSATAFWILLSNALQEQAQETVSSLLLITTVASFTALGLSFWLSFKAKPSAVLTLIFAAVEGVVIGAVSKLASVYAGSTEPVVGAVLGTFVAAGATLAAYKFFNIQVTARFRKFVTIAVLGMVGLSLVNFVVFLFGGGAGVNGYGPLGFIFSVAGLVLAIFMLITDFDAVENSIRYGAPEEESWRLAFGLTVSLVWLYMNLLRILAILRGE